MARIMVLCKEGPLDGKYVSVDGDVEAFAGVNDMPEGSIYVKDTKTLRDVLPTDNADLQFAGHKITNFCEFVYQSA